MKRSLPALLLLCCGSMALAQPGGVQRLAWLQGCWAIDTPERTVEEQWMAPRAGSLLGMSRTVRGGKLVAHESVILRERGDRFEYEVSAPGQATTVFGSVEVGDAGIVFENLAHDFPQRVGNTRRGRTLDAWIEGPIRGQTKRIEYAWRRVPCGGTD